MRKVETTARFTLIELLVVIGIIAILAAMLLPVLGQAKRRTIRVVEGSNLKQQLIGYTMYADDNSDELPVGPEKHNGIAVWHPHMFKSDFFDLEQVALDYGFIEATANPVVETAAWNDPGNVPIAGWFNAEYSPWFYFPRGNDLLGAYAPPGRLSAVSSEAVMVQTLAKRNNITGLHLAVHVARANYEFQYATQPTYRRLWGCYSASQLTSLHAGQYDGAVIWKSNATLIWTPTVDGAWAVAHVQPRTW